MSQGGVFSLLIRDERDDLLTASDYLRERLNAVRQKRLKEGKPNPQPTFIDLERTHILYLHRTYRPYVALACEYVRQAPSGDAALTSGKGSVEFRIPVYGHFLSDMVFHVRFKDVGTTSPNTLSSNDLSPRYRFCAYPGIRMFPRVTFNSGEVELDSYETDDVSFINKFEISDDRRAAWDRGMGQGELKSAEASGGNEFTEVLEYRDGLQTPKFFHASTDLWVPLQFALCGSAENSLLNDLVPNSQRKVVAELAPLKEILQAVDQTTGEVVPLPIKRLGVDIDLYVNNIFVNPEVHDLFASRIGFSLMRIRRRQRQVLNMSAHTILLDQLKFPAEHMYFGFRDLANLKDFDQWHLMGRARTRTNSTALVTPVAFWNSALGMCQLACGPAKETSSLEPIVQKVRLTAHGIDLYPEISASFFGAYIPQRYFDKTLVVTSGDASAYMATFCLYPGQFNPSGHYNLSASREFNLAYQSDTIGPLQPAELVVSMTTLNFLIRRGDSTRLRYAL